MGLLLTPSTDMRSRVRSGLLERGLAPHIADAFVMNFQDESGLNPGINEIEPIVPGSRGGFGLYQLTGPRRVAYEQFAQQRGVNPADVDAQLDFMMMELQGPESRAAQNIFAAPDTGTAAAAIVTDFLRPAEEHRNRRVARYTGGQPVMSTNSPRGILSTMNTEPEAPMQQEKIGGLLGRLFPDMDADRADELRLSLNGMLHRPNQGRAQAIQARMGGRAEGRERQQAAAQAQQQANRTIAVMRQQGAPDYLIAAAEAGQVGPAFNEFLKQSGQGPEKPNWNWNSDLNMYVDTNDPTNTYAPQGAGGPKVDVSGETDLRKEYTGRADVKEFRTQANAFARIRASAEQPDAAGDLAVIFNYMKLLDPGSTVREGEFATAQNATGVDGRVVNLYNNLLNGERLSPEQRQEFVSRAGRLYESANTQNNSTADQFRDMATDYGLDPGRTVPDMSYQSPYAPQSTTRPRARSPQAGNTAAILNLVRQAKNQLSPMDQEMFADMVKRNLPLETLQDFLSQRGIQ